MNAQTLIVLLVLLAIAATIAAVAPLRRALKRVLSQPAFVVAALVLGVAAVGLNAATNAMRLSFRKEALPLSVARLDDAKEGIPARLGPWVQVSIDEPLDHGVQEVLGTKEFVFRDYVDSRLVPREDIEWFADKSGEERAGKLLNIQTTRPEAVVRFAVTYYTGGVDTVPHVPEKCYVADGFVPAEAPATREQTIGAYADGSPRQIKYRHIHFQDTTGHGRVDRDVAYLFHVNGQYTSSNLDVRAELANLFQRYGYFAKVELMTTGRGHPDRAAPSPDAAAATQAKSLAAFNDLLGYALPEVERCLPDWKVATAKK
jgi:hypothetical protein